MNKLRQKIFETLLINTIWSVLQAIFACLSVPAIVLVSYLKVYDWIFVIVSLLLLVLLIFQWIKSSKYPKFKWDIIHDEVTHVFTFIDRETAEHTRTINAIPLRDDIIDFRDGEFSWTGNNYEASIKEKDDFELVMHEESDRVMYSVISRRMIQAHKKITYSLHLNLKDIDHTMIPKTFVYLKRPTKRLTIKLNVPDKIAIRNVRCVARIKYGEKIVFLDKNASPEDNLSHRSYVFEVKKPKLFCEYEICWDWESE